MRSHFRERTAPPSVLVTVLASLGAAAGDLLADGPASAPAVEFQDLTTFSLEELMEIEITSVRKQSESLMDAAAAVHVITAEEIRRSGARSIPEALRLVPGIQVARIDASKWAISARGFNSRFANKLLVLIDGRTVYTPLFSGVYWDAQDTLLADLERIEVIRGPGGTLWGPNAVNGVINVITRRAHDTRGSVAAAGGGTEELGFGEARHGGAIGDHAFYRVHGKYFFRDDLVDEDGDRTDDDWEAIRGGFRIDWQPRDPDAVSVQGDVYFLRAGGERRIPSLTAPNFETFSSRDVEAGGGNLLGRWTHRLTDASDFMVQAYYDRTDRDDDSVEEHRDTADIDFHHRIALPAGQEVLWGLNYRLTYDDLEDSSVVGFSPGARDVHLVSAFVQDHISLLDGRLRFTVGSKFDHGTFTDFEVQPSARVLVIPHDQHRLWAAVSRAVRTPSRAERDVSALFTVVGTVPPTRALITGDDRFTSEDLLAIEIGYRGRLHRSLSLDVAAFYNRYDGLRTFELGAATVQPGPPVHVDQELLADNQMEGDTYGVEVSATWNVLEWWRLGGSFTFLDLDLHLDAGSTDTLSEDAERQSPAHQATVRSSMDLPWNLELDALLYYVDSVAAYDVPSYFRFDARLGWRPFGDDRLDISVVAQDLLDSHHPEFGRELFEVPTEVQRGVYGMVSVRF